MKKSVGLRILIVFVGISVLYSCSLTSRLYKKMPTVGVSQPEKSKRADVTETRLPQFITYTDKDGKQKIVTEAVLDSVTGEHITTIELSEITVVSKSKNIPERNGKIDVEFIVIVPEALINKRWALTLEPELIKGDTVLKLNELVLSGKKFRKQQLRDYQKYTKFLESIIPDSVAFEQNFVDQHGFQNYMNRKSITRDREKEKDIKRELARISFTRNTEKRNKLLEERSNIVRNARAFSKRNRDNDLHNVVVTDGITADERDKKEEKINLNKITWTGTSDALNRSTRFSASDSLMEMEKFILKDKLVRNEKRKMQKEQKYNELVRHPFNEDARIDSIINTEGGFRYFYSQPVPADEYTKKMLLTLSGKVEAIDNSTFQLPLTDTITYYVSSMVQFLDKTPRFRKKIIERRAEANMSAYINFPQGKDRVDEELGNNKEEIGKIYDIIKQLTCSSEFVIDSITMTAASSPEGAWHTNEKLARNRAQSLKRFFAEKLDDKEGVDTLLNVQWIAEDWKKLEGMIVNSGQLENRDGILEIINQVKSPDARESQIRNRYRKEYNYLKDEVYPKLRVVDFKFNLHRAGMVKDTIHTTELDTDYADAIKMLEERKYQQALSILVDYNDYNTAICYMSLGYDETACHILETETESSDREYLMAILTSRLNNQEKAVRHYLRSVELDESKAWRGLLDPEINRLIMKYNLNKGN